MAAQYEQRPGYRIIVKRGQQSERSHLQPSAGYGLYQTPRTSAQTDYYRPRFPSLIDLSTALGDYDWQELLSYSRQLFSQLGNLGYAIIQKNLYAAGSGWLPQYQGNNAAWGQEAEEWLHNVWLPQCDVRGGIFDWQTDLFLSGTALDVDGDELCVYTVDEEADRFPRLRYYSAHELACGASGDVDKGPFDGAKILNGVIYDRTKRMLAVRLRDEGEGFMDIPAPNCQLLFEPEWRSQFRGMPRMSRCILDGFDCQDIDTFLKRGVKLDAAIGLLHYNEGGEAAPASSDIFTTRTTDDSAPAKDIKAEQLLGGEFIYLKANAGEKLEALKSDRPHPNTEAFIARLERRCLLSLGWFYELIDPSKVGGASVRLIQDEARHSIGSRQRTLAKKKRAIQFAVGVAQETGRISRNGNAADMLKWGFSTPALLTVDAGYDEQADRENLIAGTTTLTAVCQKRGAWWEKVRQTRLAENLDLIDKAVALVQAARQKGFDLTLREALQLMQGGENTPKDPKPAPPSAAQEKPA